MTPTNPSGLFSIDSLTTGGFGTLAAGQTSASYNVDFAGTSVANPDYSATFVLHMSDDHGIIGAQGQDLTVIVNAAVVVPEPGTLLLLGIGLIGLLCYAWRKRK